ncbi:MAG: arabinan endo-1,5-alpha-L-arabinosidase [Planctomyces sp.]|nr:arabinan endo-1,5-alpha-L-arabinosidase [Planctomyces sp.]
MLSRLRPFRSLSAVVSFGTVCAAVAVAQPPQAPTPNPPETTRRNRQPRIHDPSTIVRCGEEFWMFATGMGVSSWRSPDLIDWKPGPPVFPEPPAWITDVIPNQRGHFWAPDVIEHDGRFLLYYSVSTFGKQTSAIALASSKSLDPASPDYGWTDHGIVIQTDERSDFNAIDPGLIRTSGGDLWMSLGSFWSGLKLIQLDPVTGLRIAPDSPVHAIANKPQIEAPAIVERDGWFYQFVNWGWCCRGVESTYSIRVGRSREIAGPYLDREGVDLLQGGGTPLLDTEGTEIGPGHAAVLTHDGRDWLSYHFYDGAQQGRSRMAIRPLAWDAGGWPAIDGEPIARVP